VARSLRIHDRAATAPASERTGCRFLPLLLKGGKGPGGERWAGVRINRECHGDKAAESIIPGQNRSPN
jgi:hypothetical protein